MFADVAVCLPLSRTFVYEIAEARRNRLPCQSPFPHHEVEGFVVGFPKTPPAGIEIQSVREVLDRGVFVAAGCSRTLPLDFGLLSCASGRSAEIRACRRESRGSTWNASIQGPQRSTTSPRRRFSSPPSN